MIKSLGELKETLSVVTDYLPKDKRCVKVKERVDVLIVNMSRKDYFAENLVEGSLIIKRINQLLGPGENKVLLHREIKQLNLLLIKWKAQRAYLPKNGCHRGAIISRYF